MSASSDVDTAEMAAVRAPGRRRPDGYSARVRVDLGGRSDRGRVRENNEDHFLVCRFGRALETALTNLPDGVVPPRADERGYALAVADGMGGKAAGEEASRLAIGTLVNLILETPDWILRTDDEPLREELRGRAAGRYEQVNQALAAEAEDRPRLRGFGTTLTLAFSLGRDLFVAHVGDSRAYLLTGGRLRRLTRDHTLAQAMADRHLIEPHQVNTHRLRHVLVRCLGDHGRPAEPDVFRVELADGDRLMLCSDGLTEMVDDATIARELAAGGPAQAAADRLVDLALDAGGKDNVTVVVAEYRLP